METIIVALDGTESERALPAARELAKQFMSRIVVLHVNQLVVGARGGRFSAHVDEDDRTARLHEIVAKLRADGFEADLELASTSLAHPATVIARKAKEHGAGAIVIATRGHKPVVGVLASSVAQRLLHDAPCPVMVITPSTTRETFHAVRGQEPFAA